VYKGTKKIKEHFNGEGILFLDDIDINKLTPELYYSKMEAIRENFELVKNYMLPEDYIYLKYINKYL
jgi:hypothetical protein